MRKRDLRPWHRLFGIALTDLFTGSPWRVELEKELALKSQLLDVVIIERVAGAASGAPLALPDGLDGLRAHNLLTYKSRHEPVDAWALDELIGHYVNYRKLIADTSAEDASAGRSEDVMRRQERLPSAGDFKLYAIATRDPRGLRRRTELVPTAWPGVYDVRWGSHDVRLVVLNAIDKHPRNAPWELFSIEMDRICHGVEHYQPHSRHAETLLYELYLRFQLESPAMAYTLEDFARDSREHILTGLPPSERLAFAKALGPEDRLAFLRELSAEERRAFLKELSAEDRRAFLKELSAEERRAFLKELSAEERRAFLKELSAEERRAFLKELSAEERRAFLRELSVEERRAFFNALSADERQGFIDEMPIEERLRGLALEERLRGLSDEELQRLRNILDQQAD